MSNLSVVLLGGGGVYTNKAGFKKFFACTIETGQDTGSILKPLTEFVNLPSALHSDSHHNFKETNFQVQVIKSKI